MDPVAGRDSVFSRGPSPPPQPQQHFQLPQSQMNVSPAPSHREPAPSGSTTHLDTLLQSLNAPQQSHASPQPSVASNIYPGPPAPEPAQSGPATPASVNAGSVSSNMSSHGNASTDRQNALLSLLGAVSSPAAAQPPPHLQMSGPPQPQQVPTPPGSAPRASSSNESQGKLLLEQLMSGSASKYSYPEPAPLGPPTGPSPPFLQNPPEPPQPSDTPYYGESPYAPRDPNREPPQLQAPAPPPTEPRAPSPGRRSLFEFVSPFDALASTSTAAKRKPVPQQPPEEQWQAPPLDPKRKSVENLMDQLTRSQPPPVAPVQPYNTTYDPYTPAEDITPQTEQPQQRAARPLPPQPGAPQPTASPRGSPPKQPAAARQQRRSADSPLGPPSQGQYGMYGSPRESPGLGLGAYVKPEHRRNGKGKGNSPTSQPQSIVFDVSQPLDEVQALPDAVKSTAIALVKVDSTFLPGTTIGATHWVAYAMTKGRVRVISRSSGDRTLLTLPPVFPQASMVSDMSVHGNRLAGVTSDGGFVVWELPDVITDDVPGRVMLCVRPTSQENALHAVKWHPQSPDLLAVASDSRLYIVNVETAAAVYAGDSVYQADLPQVSHVIQVASPIVALDWDVPRSAIAAICEDSTLSMWSINDKLPFWTSKVRGDDMPSSLTFIEGGVVVGRKNGTVFQLLTIMSSKILSTLKFVNKGEDDADMFGHASWDSRIQTLWIANNRRDSMIGLRINFEFGMPGSQGEEIVKGAYFEQLVEFGGPKPTIHFVILTADADPTGEEAHAACVAAKVPPGELALVAFSVHSTGVDQVLIRKEWFQDALRGTAARFPSFSPQSQQAQAQVQAQAQAQAPEPKPQRQAPPPVAPPVAQAPQPSTLTVQPPRLKTPPSEDVEAQDSRDEATRYPDGKGKGKGKNVGFRDSDKDKDAKARVADAQAINESPLGVALSKEIRKVEESLHTRIGRLIGKELDKQHQRLEEARANEQTADFVRQEKILKLISTELTKNTTRVVEMAVKAEVQNSVLPTLENITKNEVKAAVGNQIAKGLSESMKQGLPAEIERMLSRPDLSTHIGRTVSMAVTPVVERHVKDSITTMLIPAYTQQSSKMHQELSREIHSEILNLKKEVITWQSEALRGQETLIRELESSVRMLSDQVKFLTMNTPAPSAHGMQARSSPGPSSAQYTPTGGLSQLLRHTLPPLSQQQSGYAPQQYQPPMGPPPQQQAQQPPMMGPMPGPWSGNIAAPQASHPTQPPPLPPQAQAITRNTPPQQPEDWDEAYLAVLGTQDIRQLRELLSRSNPEAILPLNGPSPLSQAVVLTLVHRLSSVIGETSPLDEAFNPTMWWLQRAASSLNVSDPLVSPYIARVLPNVQQMLNTTKQRLSILPGGPMDTVRTISDIQDTLGRKPK